MKTKVVPFEQILMYILQNILHLKNKYAILILKLLSILFGFVTLDNWILLSSIGFNCLCGEM